MMIIFLTCLLVAILIFHVTWRHRWRLQQKAAAQLIAQLDQQLTLYNLLASSEGKCLLIWEKNKSFPVLAGVLTFPHFLPPLTKGALFSPESQNWWNQWLPPQETDKIQRHLQNLEEKEESFTENLITLGGKNLCLQGAACGMFRGLALSMRNTSEVVPLPVTPLASSRRLSEGPSAPSGNRIQDFLQDFFQALPYPLWIRRPAPDYPLAWVNRAYCMAVEAQNLSQILAEKTELFPVEIQEGAIQARAQGKTWQKRVNGVIAGKRCLLDIQEIKLPQAYGGMAIDVSEIETARLRLNQQIEAHVRTLDHLATGVAIFDRSKRLLFYNAAYRQLWSLDVAFLDQNPSDSEILDRLRLERRLEEQVDFRAWKKDLFEAYQLNETREHVWHLPDGRILRVGTNPNPQGGVTYLFDDMTAHYHLESKYITLDRVQSETLEALQEGVAVFRADGRLSLFNPAFGAIWKLDQSFLAERPHIESLARHCAQFQTHPHDWEDLCFIVAGLHDTRIGWNRRLTRTDGVEMDCRAAPLPDGATLLTFSDVTASVNIERALKERNQALMDAERLRNNFVHHVSYELRTPLTNIIGFSQLLNDTSFGNLNPKQQEYTNHIQNSSSALLAIINDILDLASIDADAMELHLSDVDIMETIEAALRGVRDRLVDLDLKLEVSVDKTIGTFHADAQRIRQILFNLLSNAIGFSEPGQTIHLQAHRQNAQVIFELRDEGCGIPAERLSRIFDRFETENSFFREKSVPSSSSLTSGESAFSERPRGVGLGLSIVKAFVELHGGHVSVESALGEGTCVRCVFPIE